MVDSFIGRMIGNIAGMSRVLDAETVVVGMQPAVAITLVELGLSLPGVRTALDVEKGMELLRAATATAAGEDGDGRDEGLTRWRSGSRTDVVLVRQAVRKWAIELGFSLVDQTKMITAASELARNTLDYGGGGTVRLEIVEDGRQQGPAADLRGPGAGHPRHRPGADRRLHDRQGHGPGPERLEAAGQRVRDRLAGRRGDPRHDHEVEMITALAADPSSWRSTKPARSARPGGGDRRWPAGSASTRPSGARRPSSSTEAATNLVKHAGGGELVLQAVERRARRTAWRSWPWTGARGWPTSAAAWPTASRRPARRATGWARSRRLVGLVRHLLRPGIGTALLARLWSRRPPAPTGVRAGLRGRGSDPAAGRGGLRRRLGDRASRDGADSAAGRRRAGPRPAGRRGGAARPSRVFREHRVRRTRPRSSRRPTLRSRARAAPPWRSPRSTPSAGELRYAGVGNIAGAILDRRRVEPRAWSRTTAPSGTRFASSRSSSIPGAAELAAGDAFRRPGHPLESRSLSRASAARHPA